MRSRSHVNNMAAVVVDILCNCFVGWFYVYGIWLYSSELIFCSIPVTAIGTLVLFIAVNFLRIPSPDAWKVEEVLGIDPSAQNSETNGKQGDSSKEPYTMRVVAHRAAPLDAPENSLTAIRKTKEKGCTAVELDITLTSDDVPIVFHDENVDRITDSTGEIGKMTWSELKTLDISSKHPFRERYLGERILSFEDAIQECIKLDLRMFIDVKGFEMKIVTVVLEAFKKHKILYSRAVVTSFNPFIIFLIRRADPQIICSMAWRPHCFSIHSYSGNVSEGWPRYQRFHLHIAAKLCDLIHTWAFNNILFYVLGLSVVLIHKDSVTASCVASWRKRGVRVIPWSVNLPSEKQFFSRILKVTYMTDTLDARAV